MRVIVLGEPPGYRRALGRLPAGIDERSRLGGRFDLIHFFTTKLRELERRLPVLRRAMVDDGTLWISWPKGASSIATELNRDRIRTHVLGAGLDLVDVKVCAVDEDWSGLKFVVRREARRQASTT